MSEAKRRVDLLERTVCYDGFFRLEKYRLQHSLFRGGMSPPLSRELFERGHAVAVLPYDPVRDCIVLLEQFRIGALHQPEGPWLVEIVAGIIEDGETPEAVARRECLEEAGVAPSRLEPICSYMVSPGGTSETIQLFCGQIDSDGVGGYHGLAEEAEDIRVFTVAFADAWSMIQSGRINSAAPIIALQWLVMNRERLRGEWR